MEELIKRNNEILKKKEAGKSYNELSKEYGLSQHRVYIIVKRLREKK